MPGGSDGKKKSKNDRCRSYLDTWLKTKSQKLKAY